MGRRVNLEEEVEPIGEKRLMDTFFKEGKKATVTIDSLKEHFLIEC